MGQLKSNADSGKRNQPDSVATGDRDAQDHERAGGIDAPSPRPEADDGQWSQQPEKFALTEDDYDAPTQPMQGWYQEEDVIRFGAAVRDMLREPLSPRQAQQAERGGR